MERPEIKLGGPQRELEEPQRELKPREPWHGMGRKGPLRTLRASRDQKGLGQIYTPLRDPGLKGGLEGLGGIQSKQGISGGRGKKKNNGAITGTWWTIAHCP